MSPALFQRLLLDWYGQYGRKDLPWQQEINPYRVWISETMLQQTQVATVIPYFNNFLERFADVDELARASVDEVLRLWSGLGYYSRARNLHKAAQLIAKGGYFPDTLQELLQLPGVGRSTAGAILSIAFNVGHPILDGNVKRVLSRFKGVSGWSGNASVNKQLWAISEAYTPRIRVAEYTQGMMDLGATVCTRSKPDCLVCPVKTHCVAYNTGSVAVLPTPKPVKAKPIRQSIFLLLGNRDNLILLEKRPPAGVWGGLWSLPEFETVDLAVNWCDSRNIHIVSYHAMAKRRHTFSHFHLDYVPLVIRTDSHADNMIMEAGHTVWYQAGRNHDLGLAAPIKLLLQQITEGDFYGENHSLRKIGD